MRASWAIEITSSPCEGNRKFLAGCGMFGQPLQPPFTATFATREEAREVLRDFKQRKAWAFCGQWASDGGTRIFRSARPVRVKVALA